MRLMLDRTLFALLILGLSAVCCAQSIHNPTLEIDLDLRSLLPSQGGSDTRLYSMSIRIEDQLAPGLRLNAYGVNKYGVTLAQQMTVEKDWGPQRLQLGMVRIPFGIYDAQETYASGLINYPLPRVDYGATSVDWGAPGVRWAGGKARMQVDAAAFYGRASGVWSNQNDVAGASLRAQTYIGDLILGVSHWEGFFDTSYPHYNRNLVHLSGLDVRYSRPHLIVRGEAIFGQAGGDNRQGWYIDAYYHLPKYEKITLVGRLEELRPDSSEPLGKQITLGVRYVADRNWIFAINWLRNNGNSFYAHTWAPPAVRNGDLLFQVYRKIRW